MKMMFPRFLEMLAQVLDYRKTYGEQGIECSCGRDFQIVKPPASCKHYRLP